MDGPGQIAYLGGRTQATEGPETLGRKARRVVVGLALAALVAVLWPRSASYTGQGISRLALGMSRTEVYAILGPPGDYRAGLSTDELPTIDPKWVRGMPPWPGEPVFLWEFDLATVVMSFHKDGTVKTLLCHSPEPVEGSALAKLRWRAERQWRRWFP